MSGNLRAGPTGDPLITVRAFRDALPQRARDVLRMDYDVVVWITQAVTAGHNPADLAEHVSYKVIGLDNAEQVMRHRLRRMARPDQDEQQ